jgi:spore coat polysaccharide biosynthesis protein SpsF
MQKDIFIQARMGSTRMPEKVLSVIYNEPLLVRTVSRIRKCKLAKNVVVITSKDTKDDKIEQTCKKFHIPVFRGSENDLLDRHYKAASFFGSDYVFKIPSDCPFADVDIITEVLKMSEKFDYVSNYHPPTFPDGLDVEGARFKILEEAWKFAEKPYEREHTFPYIWDNPKRYNIGNFTNSRGNMFMTHRWTLDYPEDLKFIKAIYREFKDVDYFSFTEILNLLKKKPELTKLNSIYNGVNWYRNEKENLKTIDSSLYQHNLELKNEK